MRSDRAAPAILQPQRRAQYLKIIALFKIAKGALLLGLACSLLFLHARGTWVGRINEWADSEILLGHSRGVTFFLHKLEELLAAGHLQATAYLALFYSLVLFTEGVGVYLQKRWAELLMIFATAALIPVELRHLWHRPSLAALLLLVANVFIVWFLYRVLKRDAALAHSTEPALVQTR